MMSSKANYQLWNSLEQASDTRQIMLIEAELASRGSTEFAGDYVGRRTIGTVGKSTYSRTAAASGDKNCSDFSSAAEAQKFFLREGGPTQDIHGLDRDGDGNACEWGATLRKSVASYKSAIRQRAASERRARARSMASSRCYVGPRGGRYTITSSGRKNYGGC